MRVPSPRMPVEGTPAGISPDELTTDVSSEQTAQVVCVDFSAERVEMRHFDQSTEVAHFLDQHRPDWSRVRWIHVVGLTDRSTVKSIAKKYDLHPLAVEDLFTSQRSKVEDYPAHGEHPGRLFVIVRSSEATTGPFHEHVCFFLGRHTLLSLQYGSTDLFDGVRCQLDRDGSRLRANDASFLLYALLDSLVDRLFPVLDDLSRRLEELEKPLVNGGPAPSQTSILQVKRELTILHRNTWPIRELVHQLCREPHECLSETARTFLRDVDDHLLQILDYLLTYRDLASELSDAYSAAVSNRTNDIMKTLTVISTIFVPLTFVAGVYGMNVHIPEASLNVTYPLFWIFSVALATSMLLWFKWRRWL